MKKVFSAMLMLACFVGSLAAQGYVAGPNCISAFTNSIGVVVVAGVSTTNIPTTMAVAFQVGKSGIGVGANIAGTNSTTTTNAIVIIELSGNGVDYFTNNLPAVGVPQSGTGYGPFYTNILPTSACIDNIVLARVKSIQNTNTASIFITNLYLNTR